MFNRFRRMLRKATRVARTSQRSAVEAVVLGLVPAVPKAVRKKKAPAKGLAAGARVSKPKPTAKPRAPLGETVRLISAGGMPARPPLARRKPTVTRGARFTSATVSAGSETRTYKLYTPATSKTHDPDALLPLVIMLHGCTQTPDDFALGTTMNRMADKHQVLVAYPAQPVGANSRKCWNWFRAGQPDHGDETAVIVEIARTILRNHPADPRRVYIAGLSAGGAAAVAVANAHPEIFAAAGVHSGLPVGAAHDPASAFMAMKFGSVGRRQAVVMPTIVFHGDADTVVHPGNGRAVAARGLATFPPLLSVTKTGKTGGRTFSRTRHGALRGKSFMEYWSIQGAGHAWSGGDAAGSFTDPTGPEASREMMRFFLQHRSKLPLAGS